MDECLKSHARGWKLGHSDHVDAPYFTKKRNVKTHFTHYENHASDQNVKYVVQHYTQGSFRVV